MTFPLTFEIYKPRERLKEGDQYRTQPEIASQMIRNLKELGFKFNLVLADSLYGESGKIFRQVLDELDLNYLVAMSSNHRAWIADNSRVQYLKWHKFKRVFSNLTRENRYIREIICGKRKDIRYWQITTDPEEISSNTTWFVMSKYPNIIPREVGNFYGLRTWVE
jgi:SRSO17 transposase